MTAIDHLSGAAAQTTSTMIVEVAARLLQDGGAGAVTTRGVAAAAGVQPPTIYRLFGDKDGLLAAVAEHVMASYVSGKALADTTDDPVADLDAGWQTHIGFGLANPVLFALLADPNRRTPSPASDAGTEILTARIHRIALSGRLAVPERRALELLHAAGTGAVLTLIRTPIERRDVAIADDLYVAVKREIIANSPAASAPGPAAAAIALRAALPTVGGLTDGERVLLGEWLDRIVTRG